MTTIQPKQLHRKPFEISEYRARQYYFLSLVNLTLSAIALGAVILGLSL